MYNEKSTEWNHKTEIKRYANPILTSEEKNLKRDNEPLKRRKYAEMSKEEQKKSDERRKGYYQKRVRELCDIAIHNSLSLFITITFKKNITDYELAKHEWELFLKRLKYRFGDDIKYIATHEKQKRGAYHFHILTTDIGFVPESEMRAIWGNGFVKMKKINTGCKEEQERVINYILKYITKDIGVETEEDYRHRKIYTSRTLNKPRVKKILSDQPIESIIFENMEKVARVSAYDVKNYQGIKINETVSIEIRKDKE